VTEPVTAALRERVMSASNPLILPGAADAITARLLEDAGAEAIYLSGAGLANSMLGVPDVGLLTLTELVGRVSAMREVVERPIVVDADTGFGNAINTYRTVRLLERAGANAIQIEDQITPKRCGHFADKSLISTEEMVQKIYAAVDARRDDFVLIARTDAREEHGLQAACDRANAYLAAGADIAFVEAPRTIEEMAQIPKLVPGVHLVNMVEGGLTPMATQAELSGFGFSIILYANAVLRAGLMGMTRAARHLLENGDTFDIQDDIMSWTDRQALVRKDFFDDLNARYAVPADGGAGPTVAAGRGA
jgi:2-methylisocitrate lyase-like PEP mutase family enzyme